MAQRLNAHQLAEIYTEEQLVGYIAKLQDSLLGAAQGGYSLDTTQGRQAVTPPGDPASIESLLSVYMKAQSIIRGTNEGARLFAGGYAP